ncbi:hypothetical protein CBS101457_005967 [Exobasidium rhododendri]|nr:hypothetical protein CBS101457_005967 [Exobasidium rhododendri]
MTHASSPLCLVRSSINIDEMFAVANVVRPGETISSSSLTSRPGGKGANVSAAVALAGGKIVISGAVGNDATWPIQALEERGVEIGNIRVLEDIPTGRAFIQVAKSGENSIVLLKGANFHPDSIADDPAKVFSSLPSSPTHLIVQNEIPLETTRSFLAYARSSQLEKPCFTIFNPSPMLTKEELRNFEWSNVDVLIVNEGEGKDLLAALIEPDEKASASNENILDGLDALKGLAQISWLVMTKGSDGVEARIRAHDDDHVEPRRSHFKVPAAKPKQIRDTTGAGDTFAGYLVAGLMKDSLKPQDVLQWAAVAAAMAVETDGAMESIPRHQDVLSRQKE